MVANTLETMAIQTEQTLTARPRPRTKDTSPARVELFLHQHVDQQRGQVRREEDRHIQHQTEQHPAGNTPGEKNDVIPPSYDNQFGSLPSPYSSQGHRHSPAQSPIDNAISTAAAPPALPRYIDPYTQWETIPISANTTTAPRPAGTTVPAGPVNHHMHNDYAEKFAPTRLRGGDGNTSAWPGYRAGPENRGRRICAVACYLSIICGPLVAVVILLSVLAARGDL